MLSIKCNSILCFSKERRGAYLCRTYIVVGVLSSIYGLDSIFWLDYSCGQFALHLSEFLHLRSIITFVASTFLAKSRITVVNRGFEKSGVKLWCLTEANPGETTFGLKNAEKSSSIRKVWISQYLLTY